VVINTIDYGIVGEAGNNFHLSTALQAEQRVDFVDLADHLGPALVGMGQNTSSTMGERKGPGLASMGIGVEAPVQGGDLGIIRCMRTCPGDEL